MKILIAGFCSALGGMERRMEAEAGVLRGLGHHVIIATPFFKQLPEWRVQLAAQGIEHVQWSPYKVFERMHLSWPFRLLALSTASQIRMLNVDSAVLFVPWNFVGMSMAYVLRYLRIPYVLSIHCLLGRQVLGENAKALLRDTLVSCRGAYGVSGPVTESFRRLYSGLILPETSLNTVLNGVDVDRFCPDSSERARTRATLGFSADSRVVLFCGRLDPMKRPRLAALAFLKLFLREPRARLLVVGSGPEEDDMRSEVASLIDTGAVHFVGHVADTVSYFRAADCYLSTSDSFEGFSLTAAEALSSGLPAVVPDDSVFRSVYGACDSVRFCDSTVPDEWASEILTMLESCKLDKDCGLYSSRQYAIKKLSLAAMEESLRDFYCRMEVGTGFKSSPSSWLNGGQ